MTGLGNEATLKMAVERTQRFCSNDLKYQLGDTMSRLIATVAGLALSALVGVASANAQTSSCSAAGANCRATVKAKAPPNAPAAAVAPYIAKCNAAEQACKSSCSGGKSVFVSITDGTQHPARSCK